MDQDDEYLDYLEPYFLEDLGFEERRQSTTDPVRLSEWFLSVPSDDPETGQEIVLSYELSISDTIGASYTENLSWYFEGVYLNTFSVEQRRQYELFRAEMDGTWEDADDFLRYRAAIRTSLPIETRWELEDFVKNYNRGEN